MFKLLILLTFISTFAYSQYCEVRIDPFTNEKIVDGGMIHDGVNHYGMFMFIKKTQNIITVMFTVERDDVVCFKDGSNAIFLFTDSTKIELYHSAGTNCKGYFTFETLGQHMKELEYLSTKTIKAIRFYSTDGFFDYNIEDKGEIFASRLKCVIKS